MENQVKLYLTEALSCNIICNCDVLRTHICLSVKILNQSPGNVFFNIKNDKTINLKSFQGGKQPMKSYMASPATIERKWYVVDAEGKTLGRLASEVAKVLRGKNKAIFTPHIDTGDYVIVVNADKIKVTGKKMDQKIYYRHSDYVGGMKETTLKEMMNKKPEDVITLAVKGMLPKGPLGRSMIKKLHVYAGPEHVHAAQQPEVLEIKSRY